MEEYEEMENGAQNAFNTPNASATTTLREEEYERSSQSNQIVPWIRAKLKTNGVESLGILKAKSGNAIKKLKMRTISRAGKSAQTIILMQIASQDRKAEKVQMKE